MPLRHPVVVHCHAQQCIPPRPPPTLVRTARIASAHTPHHHPRRRWRTAPASPRRGCESSGSCSRSNPRYRRRGRVSSGFAVQQPPYVPQDSGRPAAEWKRRHRLFPRRRTAPSPYPWATCPAHRGGSWHPWERPSSRQPHRPHMGHRHRLSSWPCRRQTCRHRTCRGASTSRVLANSQAPRRRRV